MSEFDEIKRLPDIRVLMNLTSNKCEPFEIIAQI